jgi:predicted nucleotidyltransferase
MAEKIDKQIIETVKKYVAAIEKDYKIDGVYLFGSYAKGTQTADSDIDVAVLLQNGMDKRFEEMANLYKYTRGIDSRIEPHPYDAKEFKSKNVFLANEIMQTGIKIV